MCQKHICIRLFRIKLDCDFIIFNCGFKIFFIRRTYRPAYPGGIIIGLNFNRFFKILMCKLFFIDLSLYPGVTPRSMHVRGL